jgi:hypothetical protein
MQAPLLQQWEKKGISKQRILQTLTHGCTRACTHTQAHTHSHRHTHMHNIYAHHTRTGHQWASVCAFKAAKRRHWRPFRSRRPGSSCIQVRRWKTGMNDRSSLHRQGSRDVAGWGVPHKDKDFTWGWGSHMNIWHMTYEIGSKLPLPISIRNMSHWMFW